MTSDSVRSALKVGQAKLGRPGLTVWISPDMSPGALFRASGAPHGIFKITTLNKILELDLEVAKTYDPPQHYTVWFPPDWQETDIVDRFRDAWEYSYTRAELVAWGATRVH
jgi:hypothetical protein